MNWLKLLIGPYLNWIIWGAVALGIATIGFQWVQISMLHKDAKLYKSTLEQCQNANEASADARAIILKAQRTCMESLRWQKASEAIQIEERDASIAELRGSNQKLRTERAKLYATAQCANLALPVCDSVADSLRDAARKAGSDTR